jgi:hypothetical protein
MEKGKSKSALESLEPVLAIGAPFCHSERSEESLCVIEQTKRDSSLRSE